MSTPQSSSSRDFQVSVPVSDLRAAPDGARLRQVLFGTIVKAYGQKDGAYLVESSLDGYQGFVDPSVLSTAITPTHRVVSLATHLYQAADVKSHDIMSLSFGSLLTVTGQRDAFFETSEGFFVPAVHVAELNRVFSDPAGVAELFVGTPYLWGGNSRLGIDCSGLVQTSLWACGLDCPGDSSRQMEVLGRPLVSNQPLQRGDLLFWDGHVAMVIDDTRLIHANGTHMAVVYEGIEAAMERIEAQGQGPVIGRRRL